MIGYGWLFGKLIQTGVKDAGNLYCCRCPGVLYLKIIGNKSKGLIVFWMRG